MQLSEAFEADHFEQEEQLGEKDDQWPTEQFFVVLKEGYSEGWHCPMVKVKIATTRPVGLFRSSTERLPMGRLSSRVPKEPYEARDLDITSLSWDNWSALVGHAQTLALQQKREPLRVLERESHSLSSHHSSEWEQQTCGP